ncbi:hypothetical protein ABT120_32865 [Nonomuraea angiospora]|uniref:hypothetical protein n=1 Tax=Nonomuraea angiospora TaxID=46172 RepID=UPI0033277FCE
MSWPESCSPSPAPPTPDWPAIRRAVSPPGDTKEVYLIDVPPWSSLRTERYVYTRWYDLERSAAKREYELYDLATDPYELHNLLATAKGRERHAGLVTRLNKRMAELSSCQGATCRTSG